MSHRQSKMETWVILVIVIVAIVVLAAIIAVILHKRQNANLKSKPVQQPDINGGIDEGTFKNLIASYKFYPSDRVFATQDNVLNPNFILNPNYIQTYIDDYIRSETSVAKNPLLMLQQKFNTTYSTGFFIGTSDVNLTDAEKIVFKPRKIRKHPSMTCFRNGNSVHASVEYAYDHILYRIHTFTLTKYISLSNIDDAIRVMADILQLNVA